MRRTRVALIADLIWLVAAAAGGGLLWQLGWTGAGLIAALSSVTLAFGATLVLGLRAERPFGVRLDTSHRWDDAPVEAETPRARSAAIADLTRRLERVTAFKTAFAGLEQPAVVATLDGEILGASRGLKMLEPEALEGANLEVLFGDAYEPGAMAEEQLLSINSLRFTAHHRSLGGGRVLIELAPTGAHIADDELDAFVGALAGGHTGFRFDSRAIAHAPALAMLQEVLEGLDRDMSLLNRVVAGEPLTDEMRATNSGLSPMVRELADRLVTLAAERDEHAEARARLTRKMQSIASAIESYRGSATALAEFAEGARAGVSAADEALAEGMERTKALRSLEREAIRVMSEASEAAARSTAVAASVSGAGGEIETLRRVLGSLSRHLDALSSETEVIADVLGEGAGAISRVDGQMIAIEDETTRALLLPVAEDPSAEAA